MAITTELIGALGSQGYHFTPGQGRIYRLPPNPSVWAIMVARTSGTASVDFTITNRVTGEVVTSRSFHPNGNVVEVTSVNGKSFKDASAAGIDITFANINVIVSIASGGGTPPLV